MPGRPTEYRHSFSFKLQLLVRGIAFSCESGELGAENLRAYGYRVSTEPGPVTPAPTAGRERSTDEARDQVEEIEGLAIERGAAPSA